MSEALTQRLFWPFDGGVIVVTIDEIIERAVNHRDGLTPERLAKLQKLCERSGVSYEAVLKAIKANDAKES